MMRTRRLQSVRRLEFELRRWCTWSAALFYLVTLARCASTAPLPDTGGDLTPAPPFRLLMLGDTAFGESYQARRAERGEENILQTRGYDDCLLLLDPLLDRADRVVANLETPVTTHGSSPLEGMKQYIHWADPERTPAILAKHGITSVSLANNHAMDYGPDGISRTLSALRKRGIQYFGAGLGESAAALPLVINGRGGASGGRIVIAAGFEYRNSYDERYRFYASSDAPGAPGVNNWSTTRAKKQIAGLRKKYPDALLIAYPHWGSNYAWRRTRQADLGRAIIDAGADLVIGHGSHAFQEIEHYRGRWIIYSLGNFVFNSPGRYKAEDFPPYSLMAMLELRRKCEGWAYAIRLYPIFSDNRISDYHPRPVTTSEFHGVRKSLEDRSSMLGIDVGEDTFGHYLEVNSAPSPLPTP